MGNFSLSAIVKCFLLSTEFFQSHCLSIDTYTSPNLCFSYHSQQTWQTKLLHPAQPAVRGKKYTQHSQSFGLRTALPNLRRHLINSPEPPPHAFHPPPAEPSST